MAGEPMRNSTIKIAKTNPLADRGMRIAPDLKVQKQTHFFAIRSLPAKSQKRRNKPTKELPIGAFCRCSRFLNRKNKAIKSRQDADFFKCLIYRRNVDIAGG
jgi:hypothetical protein